ncbi:MAG: VCBS repeat-containing protein, partial [Bacteroidota bacterium]
SSQGLAPYASVRFEYEDRPDKQLTFVGGSEFRLLKRMKRIRMYYGNSPVRSYHMTYANNAAAQFSRITKIQECGSDGNCFQPIHFNWGGQNESGNFAIQNSFFPPNNYAVDANDYNFLPGDFDGDGKDDLIHFANRRYAHVWLSNGDGTYNVQGAFPNNGYGLDANDYLFYPGDFNGDGLTDLIHFVNSHNAHVWISNGDGTFQILPAFNLPNYGMNGNNYNYQTGDFNGDGRTDLIHLAGNRTAVVWLSNGNGTFTLGPGFPNTNYGVNANNYNFLSGDFNGDGMTDMVHIVNDDYLHVWESKGDGTFTIQNAFPNNGYSLNDNDYNFRVGDYNGDGKTDLLHLASNSRAYTWTSKGDGTFAIQLAIPQGSYNINSNNYNYVQGDFNGDGLTDLAHLANKRFLRLWYATGNGTFNIAGGFPNSGYGLDSNNYGFLAGDHTGDGKTDLMHFVSRQYMVVWTSPSTFEQLKVNKITNGNKINEFDYFPLTNDIVYTKSTQYTYPKMNYRGPKCVVGDMRVSDGLGGMNAHAYRYVGGKFDLQGRGFRGFDRQIHFDFTRNYKTTTVYDRDFKCITSRVRSQEVRLISNNKRINRIDNQIQIVPKFGGRVHFSHFKLSTVREFELNNQLIQRKQEQYAYDHYGNMTLKETKYFNSAN